MWAELPFSCKYSPGSVSCSTQHDGVLSQHPLTSRSPWPDFCPFHSEEILVREALKCLQSLHLRKSVNSFLAASSFKLYCRKAQKTFIAGLPNTKQRERGPLSWGWACLTHLSWDRSNQSPNRNYYLPSVKHLFFLNKVSQALNFRPSVFRDIRVISKPSYYQWMRWH